MNNKKVTTLTISIDGNNTEVLANTSTDTVNVILKDNTNNCTNSDKEVNASELLMENLDANMKVYNVVYIQEFEKIKRTFGSFDFFVDYIRYSFCYKANGHFITTIPYTDERDCEDIFPPLPEKRDVEVFLLLSEPQSLASIARTLSDFDSNGNPNINALVPLKDDFQNELPVQFHRNTQMPPAPKSVNS